MFAVLNLYKPEGPTSHDMVSALRKVFNLKKVGHLGTLDPMAEGVLPLCLGKATRLIEYFPTDKRYTAEVTLGRTTITLDREGEILTETPCPDITDDAIRKAILPFVGTIEQEVPQHAAVHVGGKKLYEYAHQGIAVKAPVKTVTIHSIEVLDIRRNTPDNPVVMLDVRCGSGTYIRAIARDLGNALGCGGVLTKLIRTEHGLFTAESAIQLADLQASDTPHQYLQDPVPLLGLPVVPLSAEENAIRLSQGMKIDAETPLTLKGNQLCLVSHQQQPVAVAQWVQKKLKPIKVFYQPVS